MMSTVMPECTLLTALIKRAYPELHQQRLEELAADGPNEQLERATIPIFVLDATLPKEERYLHIFEERYQIMMRRVLEGGRCAKFGMKAQSERTGTEVEIIECRPQPGGRMNMKIIGRRIFTILEESMTDGYITGTIEYRKDFTDNTSSAAPGLSDKIDTWTQLMTSGHWISPVQLSTIKQSLGPIPHSQYEVATWIGVLLSHRGPMGDPSLKARLISATPSEWYQISTSALDRSITTLQSGNHTSWAQISRFYYRYPALSQYLPILLVLFLLHFFVHGDSDITDPE